MRLFYGGILKKKKKGISWFKKRKRWNKLSLRKKGVYIYAYDTRTIYHPKYETTVYVTAQKQLNINKNKKKEKKKIEQKAMMENLQTKAISGRNTVIKKNFLFLWLRHIYITTYLRDDKYREGGEI